MACRMSILFGYVIFLGALVQCAIGHTHTVGEDMGWTIPSSSDAYSTWASSKNFIVGDTLLFNFPGVHTVAEVSKAAYDACDTKSIPIGGSILSTSPSTIRLNTAGAHFYICTVGEHCMFGQKLFINVNGINRTTTSTPPPTTATPPHYTAATPPRSTIATPPPSTIATPPSSVGTPLSSMTTPPSIETPNTISVAPTEGPNSIDTRGNSGSSSSSLAVAKISLTLLFSATLVLFL